MKSVYSSSNAYADNVTPERNKRSSSNEYRGSSVKLAPIHRGHHNSSLGKARVKTALGSKSSKSIRSQPSQLSCPDTRGTKEARAYGRDWQSNSVEKPYKGYNVPLKLSYARETQ